jgi:hypothetical protein
MCNGMGCCVINKPPRASRWVSIRIVESCGNIWFVKSVPEEATFASVMESFSEEHREAMYLLNIDPWY